MCGTTKCYAHTSHRHVNANKMANFYARGASKVFADRLLEIEKSVENRFSLKDETDLVRELLWSAKDQFTAIVVEDKLQEQVTLGKITPEQLGELKKEATRNYRQAIEQLRDMVQAAVKVDAIAKTENPVQKAQLAALAQHVTKAVAELDLSPEDSLKLMAKISEFNPGSIGPQVNINI